MEQNTSHAVMAQRYEGDASLDDFPTPPWATRALMEHVLGASNKLEGLTVLEPACGRGHMSRTLAEYFGEVVASDIHDYGSAPTADFLDAVTYRERSFDWVITNPPFRLAEEFITKAARTARAGVAMLVRTAFIESTGRYNRLFSTRPPAIMAQFSERVPMVKGRLDPKASTATSYAWLVWRPAQWDGESVHPCLSWIPPCRKALERDGDYGIPSSGMASRHKTRPVRAGAFLFGLLA